MTSWHGRATAREPDVDGSGAQPQGEKEFVE
jgi:hypothetical protein